MIILNNKNPFFYRDRQKKLNLAKRIIYLPLVIVLLIQIFTSFFYSPYVITNNNMYPTVGLAKNDWIWIDKISYGLLKPFKNNFPDNRYLKEDRVARGDVVAMVSPLYKSSAEDLFFFHLLTRLFFYFISFGLYHADDVGNTIIRRVVALPGELVSIKGKKIYINDKEFSPDWEIYFNEKDILTESISIRDNMQDIFVPENSVFVLNDNWDITSDSRKWGGVPIYKIRGKVKLQHK